MIFALWCLDKRGMGDVRAHLMDEHRAYWGGMRDKMAFGGPLTTSDGAASIGSLIVAEFEDREAVDNWLAQEPFMRAGVYETVSIEAFRNVWPQEVGFPPAPMP